jgi:TRAP-type C4-dicarboxylate transport system permease small subunit
MRFRALRKANRIFDRILDLSALLAAVIAVVIMLGILADVLLRYIFKRPTGLVIEYSEYGILYFTFLAAAWVLRGEKHIKLDLVLNQLTPASRHLLNGLTSIIGAIIFLIIGWYAAQLAKHYFLTGDFMATVLRTPKFIVAAIIPVGSFLLFIQFLRRAYGYLSTWRQDKKI